MSGTPNYLKAGDINMSTRSREIVDYLARRQHNQLLRLTKIGALPWVAPCIILGYLTISRCDENVSPTSESTELTTRFGW